jgi:hypothetical protein
MATRWTNRVNPLNWFTRRQGRPVARHEYATPAVFVETEQPRDDYTAADRPALSTELEWFAEEQHEPEEFGQVIAPTYTLAPHRPRTLNAEYDVNSHTLRVTYREGAKYDYPGVTPEQWASLRAERTSTGKWLQRNGLAGPGSGIRVN